MNHVKNYKLFLEEMNPNTPQNYLNSLSKKTKPKLNTNQNNKNQQNKIDPDSVDNKFRGLEEQKAKILAQQNIIGNDLTALKPETAKTVVKDYEDEIINFDNTLKDVRQDVDNIDKSVKKAKIIKPIINPAREKNF